MALLVGRTVSDGSRRRSGMLAGKHIDTLISTEPQNYERLWLNGLGLIFHNTVDWGTRYHLRYINAVSSGRKNMAPFVAPLVTTLAMPSVVPLIVPWRICVGASASAVTLYSANT